VSTGAAAMGQGTATMLAQIAADEFNVAPADIKVIAGDTAVIPHGQGGFASRQTVTAGSAVHLAAVKVREKALAVAAHLLEASVSDLAVRDGRIEIAGAPGSGLSLREVAEAVSGVPGYSMPGQFEPGLENMQSFLPSALTYGGGCHAVEVEVDIETCDVRILRYIVVNDSGRIINPMIVAGQLVGGAAHAIGNALYEWMGYDDAGQPVTTSVWDDVAEVTAKASAVVLSDSISPRSSMMIMASGTVSRIERRPRAPVLRSIALRATAPSASSANVSSMFSISNKR